jgi:hypothetical protein
MDFKKRQELLTRTAERGWTIHEGGRGHVEPDREWAPLFPPGHRLNPDQPDQAG